MLDKLDKVLLESSLKCNCDCYECKIHNQEMEQLADETIKLMRENAQNSMMIEVLISEKDELINVLKQARKALYVASAVLTKEPYELAREVLAEIDKLMGVYEW